MKNVQVIDGADNSTFSVFRATNDEFAYLFPNPGQDIEFAEDFVSRHHESHVAAVLDNLWLRPIHKRDVSGIDGTLFFQYAARRQHLPATKREIDRNQSQLNSAQRDLYAIMKAADDGAAETTWPVTTMAVLEDAPGGQELLQWFGGQIPGFHDAEVLTVLLDRQEAQCVLRIHTFEMTSEVDSKGFFVLKNHVVICLRLQGVVHLELQDFNHQNVIYGLSITKTANNEFRVELDQCNGIFGFIEARTLTIKLEPGKPAHGVYSPNDG